MGDRKLVPLDCKYQMNTVLVYHWALDIDIPGGKEYIFLPLHHCMLSVDMMSNCHHQQNCSFQQDRGWG